MCLILSWVDKDTICESYLSHVGKVFFYREWFPGTQRWGGLGDQSAGPAAQSSGQGQHCQCLVVSYLLLVKLSQTKGLPFSLSPSFWAGGGDGGSCTVSKKVNLRINTCQIFPVLLKRGYRLTYSMESTIRA